VDIPQALHPRAWIYHKHYCRANQKGRIKFISGIYHFRENRILRNYLKLYKY
jgi:hypothetical protein